MPYENSLDPLLSDGLGEPLPASVSGAAAETPAPTVYPTAILPFQERGPELKDMGAKVADVLFAALAADPSLYLVDRAEMDKLAAEAELNLSGMVASGQTTKLGELCGARILVTGNVMQVDRSIYLVAKIIGTETSRVLGHPSRAKPVPPWTCWPSSSQPRLPRRSAPGAPSWFRHLRDPRTASRPSERSWARPGARCC